MTILETERRAAAPGIEPDERRDLEALIRLIASIQPIDGATEALPGVRLHRSSCATEVGHSISTPELCVIAQGTKEWILGSRTYAYDSGHYLIATAELPVGTRVVNASPDAPYLGAVIALDPALVGSVMVEAGQVVSGGPSPAVDVSRMDAGLLNAVVRLLALAETPAMAGFLAPLIKREIVYRLLMGSQGRRLHQVAIASGTSPRIMEAIQRIRRNFDQPLRIEDEARRLGMSLSTFHAHFKAITELSPLEYQKRLRLQEARRLMFAGGLDAGNAGARVGYNDASQFTREYKRLFGAPPMRDIARLRESSTSPSEF